MSNRFTRWLREGLPLWLILLTLAWIYVLPVLVPGPPLPEYLEAWSLQEKPWVGGLFGGFCVAVLFALWLIPPQRHGARRILKGVTFTGVVVGALVFIPALLFSLLGWNAKRPAEKNESVPPTPPPVPHPPLSPLFVIVPVVLALAATLLHHERATGELLPRPTPEEWLLRSHHYLSAAPVMSPPTEGGSRVLLPDPRVTRKQLLEHVRDDNQGWWAAHVLLTLEERKRLAALPLTDEARVRALPLDSDVLVTPEGEPLTRHPLWGVVVEAESLQKQRLLLVSLSADDPALEPTSVYGLLFEESATGGPPRLLKAMHVFPSASGRFGSPPRDLFILYLIAFLIGAILVAAGLQLRAPRAQRSTPPARPEPTPLRSDKT